MGDIFDSEMPTLLLRRHYKGASGFPHHALLSINSILEHGVLIEFKRKSFPGYPEATDTFPHGMGLNLIEFTVLLHASVLHCCWTDQLCSNKSLSGIIGWAVYLNQISKCLSEDVYPHTAHIVSQLEAAWLLLQNYISTWESTNIVVLMPNVSI